MPKRNPRPDTSYTPRPPVDQPPISGGGDPPVETPDTLICSLVDLNVPALDGLRVGEPLSLRALDGAMVAWTVIGTRLGTLTSDDEEVLSNKTDRRARVFGTRSNPPSCIIEVFL